MKKLKKTVKKKTAPKKKKSYYKPKKTAATPVAKKKYKSYYKSKKQREYEAVVAASLEKARKNPNKITSALIAPKNVKTLTEAEADAEFSKYPIATPANKEPTPSKRPVKYLNNRDLLAQVVMSKQKGKMTNDLAKMLQLLTMRYGKKGNFANYTYNDDMQSYAMLMLVKTWHSFDPAKSSNPFAFFTQCIKNSFIQYLNYEKRQRDIRDEVLVDKGMAPSFGFMYDHEEKQREADVADQEVIEAPTKLHEDVDSFHSEPDTGEDEPTSES